MGYVVFSCVEGEAAIVDVFGHVKVEVLGSLVKALLRILRDRQVEVVSMSVQASHPVVAMVLELGFRRRESHSVVAQWHSSWESQIRQEGQVSWCLCSGDRDS